MSKINKNYIYFPKNTLCEFQRFSSFSVLWISGLFGTWFVKIPVEYKVVVLENKLVFLVNKFFSLSKLYASNFKLTAEDLAKDLGLLIVFIKRVIWGASVGFKKYLRVRGVGYKFVLHKNILKANVGFTHAVDKIIPKEFVLKFSKKSKMLRLKSKSLFSLTSVLSALRAKKRPDVYKGKGIRYKKENLIRKEGKKKKTF